MDRNELENRELGDAEVSALLKEYLSWYPWIRNSDVGQKVAEKLAEFIGILGSIKANIAGEVLSALAVKERDYETFGEWVSEPTAVYTDGHALGYDHDNLGGAKVIVNILLDASESMSHADGVSYLGRYSGNLTSEAHKNPLLLTPRIFLASIVARYIRKSLMEAAVEMHKPLEVNSYVYAAGGSGHIVEPYLGQVWLKHPNQGGGTPMKFLGTLKENEYESVGAAKLDLVITDGLFEEYLPRRAYERREAESHQYERVMGGGSVTTVIMNMMPESAYNDNMKDFWDGRFGDEEEKDRNWSLPYSVMYFTESPQMLAQVFSMSLQDFFRRL